MGRVIQLEVENFKSYAGSHTIGPFKDFTVREPIPDLKALHCTATPAERALHTPRTSPPPPSAAPA